MKSETKEKIAPIFTSEDIISEITCGKAMKLCEAHNIDPFDLGKYCDMYQVKLKNCRIGCFT